MVPTVSQSRGGRDLTVWAPRLEDSQLGNSGTHFGLRIVMELRRIPNPQFSTVSRGVAARFWNMRGRVFFLGARQETGLVPKGI